MNRRLEDRVRHLCRQAVTTYDTDEFFLAIQELRSALREHASRLRVLSEARLLVGLPVVERRADLPGEAFGRWSLDAGKSAEVETPKAESLEAGSEDRQDKRVA